MKVSGSLSGVDQPTMLLVICIVVAVLSTASNIDCVVSNDFRWNCFDIGVMGLISSLTLGFFCSILVIYNNLTFEFTEEALVTKHYFIEFRTDFTYDSIDKIELYFSFLEIPCSSSTSFSW